MALRKIKETGAAYLRTRRPLSIKREELSGGHPEDARADICWIIEEKDAGRELTPRVNDEDAFAVGRNTCVIWFISGKSNVWSLNRDPRMRMNQIVALQRHGFEGS